MHSALHINKVEDVSLYYVNMSRDWTVLHWNSQYYMEINL